MKRAMIKKLAKKNMELTLYELKGYDGMQQWIGVGGAAYLIKGMPQLGETGIYTLLDFSEADTYKIPLKIVRCNAVEAGPFALKNKSDTPITRLPIMLLMQDHSWAIMTEEHHDGLGTEMHLVEAEKLEAIRDTGITDYKIRRYGDQDYIVAMAGMFPEAIFWDRIDYAKTYDILNTLAELCNNSATNRRVVYMMGGKGNETEETTLWDAAESKEQIQDNEEEDAP